MAPNWRFRIQPFTHSHQPGAAFRLQIGCYTDGQVRTDRIGHTHDFWSFRTPLWMGHKAKFWVKFVRTGIGHITVYAGGLHDLRFTAMITSMRCKLVILIFVGVLLSVSFFLVRKATPRVLGTRLGSQWPTTTATGISCPSPYDVALPHIDHTQQHCVSVPSAILAFELEFCQAPDACNAFTFRVRRADIEECRRAEAGQDPSQDKALSDWIRAQRGPDGFMLRADGAERIGSELSIHESNCSYRFDVHLKNPGQLYVEAWLTYEVRIRDVKYSIALNRKMLIVFQNYVGYSETNSSWPEMQLRPLLANPIELSSCPSHCTPVPPKPLLPSRTFFTYPTASASTSISTAALPACSGREPIRGSYLPAHPLDILYPPFGFSDPIGTPVVGRYQFVPIGCEWKHAGRRFGDASKCTKTKKNVLVIGDSHGRVVYDAMLHRLQGNRDILTKSVRRCFPHLPLGSCSWVDWLTGKARQQIQHGRQS